MFCSSCGAQTNGASFCPNCGSPADAAGTQSSSSQVPPVQPTAPLGQPQGMPGQPMFTQQPFAVQQTNGMAIAALVTSLVCCPPVGIVLGFVARKQIKDSNGAQTGDGLALSGIIIGFVFTGLGIIYGIAMAALLPYGYYGY